VLTCQVTCVSAGNRSKVLATCVSHVLLQVTCLYMLDDCR